MIPFSLTSEASYGDQKPGSRTPQPGRLPGAPGEGGLQILHPAPERAQKTHVDQALKLLQTSGYILKDWIQRRDDEAGAELRRVKWWRLGWACLALALGFLALSGRWGL